MKKGHEDVGMKTKMKGNKWEKWRQHEKKGGK